MDHGPSMPHGPSWTMVMNNDGMSKSQPPVFTLLHPTPNKLAAMAFSNSNSNSNSNLNKTGIKVASCLPHEIQCIILKFIIVDFFYFLDRTYYKETDDTHIQCSKNIQSQLLSMTGYDDLLDDIICMALDELELEYDLGSSIFIDDFTNFVRSRSVQLKSVGLTFKETDDAIKQFTNDDPFSAFPHIFDFHSDSHSHSHSVPLKWDISSLEAFTNCPPLKFVSFISCSIPELTYLMDSNLLNKLTSWTKLSVDVYWVTLLTFVDINLDLLQLYAQTPTLKHLYLNCILSEEPELCDDFLVKANTLIRQHKNLHIIFDIHFTNLPIPCRWIIDSKAQLSLPFHTEHPINTREVDMIEQWCSVSGIRALTAPAHSRPSLSNTPKIYFTRAINSTVSTLLLQKFSTEYEIVLDRFSSLKKLEIANSVLKKFPSLPESLRELTIEYVNDLTMSDMDHGIILPTRLCSLIWHGNLSCFTLPKILNIDKLLSLKDVSIRISPLEVSDEFDGSLYDLNHHVTKEFLRITNTCTIDQLQQFVSQLPSDLEILKINIDGYIRPNLNNYSSCSPDEISFKHFTKLDRLELKCFNNSNPFNVSAFPGVESLNFLSPPVLSGSFAQGIRSLEVDLESYGETVSHFLSHFISKLTSLVCLSIVIIDNRVADIRTLPSQLCSFRIKVNKNHYAYPKHNRNNIESIIL
ncbi:unnamed protein product [Ambrosiozyma monospora]|uniref:Unnamed protein product n=1 Tax=Ambrosiozyma monospora TaxID=43982 RepID=A0A9W6Z1W0_AMBMO|nr:unnamed protein product [Ambrosiozyma monospora]